MIKLLPLKSIFIVSFLLELLALLFIRIMGIDWDYHPDAITYIKTSSSISVDIYNMIFNPNFCHVNLSTALIKNIFLIINKGFYFMVNFLGSRQINILILNIFLFSITNYFIALILRPFKHKYYEWFEYLVIFNPYRVYLATAILKDTTVIFLLIISFYFYSRNDFKSKYTKLKKSYFDFFGKLSFLFFSFISLVVALRSIIYMIVLPRFFDNLKKIKPLILIVIIVIGINYYFESGLLNAFNNASVTDMNFRDYGNIPNFSSLGTLGTLLRIIIWPILYVSGIFFFFSPSLKLSLIALGLLFISFILFKLKKVPFLGSSFLGMSFFAGITSGFLSFSRYVLPIWLLSTMVIYIKESPNYKKISKNNFRFSNNNIQNKIIIK